MLSIALLALLGAAQACTAPAQDAECEALIDYALVVDNSASIVNDTDSITQFLQDFVAEFNVADGYVKFSVIAFGYTVETLTPLTSDSSTIDNAITNRGDQGGSTNIAAALYALSLIHI